LARRFPTLPHWQKRHISGTVRSYGTNQFDGNAGDEAASPAIALR